ncbi:hypothetical protein C8Q80DRAFT_200739 [Daedaleopsis nitida]|nr:hypothetical protein C8Q80DRAFT_200739 [Daedaleopsis nitida]
MANKAFKVPTNDFFNTFLPLPRRTSTISKTASTAPPNKMKTLFQSLRDARKKKMKEDLIATRFVHVVNKHKLAPGLALALSQAKSDPDDPSKQRIDAAFFPEKNVPVDGRPHWVDALIGVEFKRDSASKDPFDDRGPKVDADADERKEVRGQLISYAEKSFAVQQRIFLFTLLIIGRRFRIIRWDRSGTITTPSIDYVAHPEILCELLLRLASYRKPADLGFDPTAHRVLPGSRDYKLMDYMAEAVDSDLPAVQRIITEKEAKDPVFAYVRDKFRDSLDKDWPRWKLEVHVADPHSRSGKPKIMKYLVGKPSFCVRGMAGRGTRGYVAIDCNVEPKRFVWLKDAWRANYEKVAPEGEVLAELNDAGVENVPTLVCWGDLPGQATKTPDYWDWQSQGASEPPSLPADAASQAWSQHSTTSTRGSKRRRGQEESAPQPPRGLNDSVKEKASCPLRRHRHCRVVVEEVGLPLSSFKSARHLVSIVYDCMIAHRMAVEKTSILHRDISGGNILILPVIKTKTNPVSGITQTGVVLVGILTDWELSKDISPKPGKRRVARQPARTGTWQFMSVALLNEARRAVGISDELESLFYVIVYYGTRYLPSNCLDVGAYIEQLFDAHVVQNGRYESGAMKFHTMKYGDLMISSTNGKLLFKNTLDPLLRKMLDCFKAHYQVMEYETSVEAEKAAAAAGAAAKAASSQSAAPEQMNVDWDADEMSFDPDEPAPPGFNEEDFFAAPIQVAHPKPDAETYELANKLKTHDYFCGLMHAFLRGKMYGKTWAQVDDVRDRIRLTYRPRVKVAPIDFPPPSSNKRIKVDPDRPDPLPFAPSQYIQSFTTSQLLPEGTMGRRSGKNHDTGFAELMIAMYSTLKMCSTLMNFKSCSSRYQVRTRDGKASRLFCEV